MNVSTMRVPRLLILVLLVSLAAGASLSAQQPSITGTVDDGTGVVPDATVSFKDGAGTMRQVTTDNVGKYRIDNLRPGEYQVTAGRDGYATTTRAVMVGKEAQLVDITLQVGGLETSVDVVGTATGGLTNSLVARTNAGSRLDMTALETPASVTTLSGTDIRLRGDLSVNSSVTRAVGVTSTYSIGASGTTVAARGFGGNSVGLVYDGIRSRAQGGSSGVPYDPWTVDRLEVLNGPASVLVGVGGIGGTINVVPRKPSRDWQHTFRVAAASFDTYRLAVDSTGPVSDRVLYRVDVSRQGSSGYIDRGDSNSTVIFGALTFLISPTVKATLTTDWARIEPMNDSTFTPLVNGAPAESLRHQNFSSGDVNVNFVENMTRFEVQWTPRPNITVRNISAMVRGKRLWLQGAANINYRPATGDVIRSAYARYDQDQTQWNNQTEVSIDRPLFGGANNVVFGADGEFVDFTRYVTMWPGQFDVVSLVNPVPGAYPRTNPVITQAQDNDVRRYSAFAEDRWQVSKNLSLVGGLRWDHQNFNRIDLVTPVRTSIERLATPVNWRAGAVYTVARDLNVYGQYSVAVDTTGSICCVTPAQMAFTTARGRQVEAGIKQVIGGGRAEWTLAGYKIIKNDLLIPDPLQVGTLIQVGSQSSAGVEATAAFDLGHGLHIGVNGTVLRPQFDDFFENVGGVRVSRAGNRPTNVPWQSGNVFGTWSFMPNWLAQGTVRFVGDRYIDTANTLVVPSYTVLDASLRRSLTNRMAVDFRVMNIGDAYYGYNFTGNGLGGANWNLGMPRSFEISLTAGF